jgi:hypothetical protein
MDDIVSQLSLDSWEGIVSFIASIAISILPFLLKRRRKQKKREAKTYLNKDAKLKIIGSSRYWIETDAKIIRFEFAKGEIPISKKLFDRTKSFSPNALLAVIEFKMPGGRLETANLYIGDEYYEEGDVVEIRYNPEMPIQTILVK